ncbi:hypothetical protein PtB15_8B441 [Puccinia triticina]|nr:hypothetical protein PtB15_8B441 [Puccinia triticina]
MAQKYDIFDQGGDATKTAKRSTPDDNQNQADKMQVDEEATNDKDPSQPNDKDPSQRSKPANTKQTARANKKKKDKVEDSFVEGFIKIQKEYKADPLLTRFKLHMPFDPSAEDLEINQDMEGTAELANPQTHEDLRLTHLLLGFVLQPLRLRLFGSASFSFIFAKESSGYNSSARAHRLLNKIAAVFLEDFLQFHHLGLPIEFKM